MMDEAAYSVAMADAHPALAARARYRAPSNTEAAWCAASAAPWVSPDIGQSVPPLARSSTTTTVQPVMLVPRTDDEGARVRITCGCIGSAPGRPNDGSHS